MDKRKCFDFASDCLATRKEKINQQTFCCPWELCLKQRGLHSLSAAVMRGSAASLVCAPWAPRSCEVSVWRLLTLGISLVLAIQLAICTTEEWSWWICQGTVFCRALSAFLLPEMLGSPELLAPLLCSRCISCSFVAPHKSWGRSLMNGSSACQDYLSLVPLSDRSFEHYCLVCHQTATFSSESAAHEALLRQLS